MNTLKVYDKLADVYEQILCLERQMSLALTDFSNLIQEASDSDSEESLKAKMQIERDVNASELALVIKRTAAVAESRIQEANNKIILEQSVSQHLREDIKDLNDKYHSTKAELDRYMMAYAMRGAVLQRILDCGSVSHEITKIAHDGFST